MQSPLLIALKGIILSGSSCFLIHINSNLRKEFILRQCLRLAL